MCRLVFGSVVLGVGLLMAAPAMAQERSSLSGNVALTDIEASDDLIAQAFTTEARADDRVVLTIKRAL